MAIEIAADQRDAMVRHAEESYPHECCGILLGQESEGLKRVSALFRAANLRDDSPQNRYLIDPREFLRADKHARESGMEIVGIYHSHPDHPARPSEFDREHAWPYYSYVIFSVQGGTVVDAASWLLKDDRSAFEAEEAKGLQPRQGA